MDQMVLRTQQWLNRTYRGRTGFGSVVEDGQTGWGTVNALIRALQIELGITATANNFGPGTQEKFRKRWPNGIRQQTKSATHTSNVYGIIQGALWCKGYSTGADDITKHFYAGTGSAVKELKLDIGIGGDSTVDLGIMRALLSMQQFKLLKEYGGDLAVRVVQQEINREYRDYTGIIPADGVYGREMNTALIEILQAIEGFSPDEATGTFGPGTRGRLMTIDKANAAAHPKWVWMGSVALICNGYGVVIAKGWSIGLSDYIRQFQEKYALPQTGTLTPTTWMSLLTSKGDPDRPCEACDTRFEITDERLATLKADGYRIVGRYLTEPGQDELDPSDYFKAIRPGELERIIDGGLRYFPIFQEYSTKPRHFSAATGADHARKAREAAQRLRVPPTHIYFAVDYDATDPEIDAYILPYFQAIHANLGNSYKVGIYASRNICTRIISAGFAGTAFVSDMSTGFSGNLGYYIPENWTYDQFAEISDYKGQGWDLDRVSYSRRTYPCATLLSSTLPDPDTDPLYLWTRSTETACGSLLDAGIFNRYAPYKAFISRFILEWLRKPEYWGNNGTGLWTAYTDEIPDPEELEATRTLCANICKEQPAIKGTLPNRDIDHMAATALGYLHWGFEERPAEYSYGDLGGWPLDLLQIWGSYRREESKSDLTTWARTHIGSMSDGKGFGYDDVLADADAYLIMRHLSKTSSVHALSSTMRSVFTDDATGRIARFYDERFGRDPINCISAFQSLADGIDVGIKNIGKSKLCEAAGTDRLPSPVEAAALAEAFASFLQDPRV